MRVDRPGAEIAGDRGESEVVGGNEADGAPIQQSAQDAGGTRQSIVRVGAVKQLVEQEQDRPRGGSIGDVADARDLGEKSRSTLLQRVLDSQRGADVHR